MLDLDDRPTPPPLPQFGRDMEQFLLAAARAGATPQIGPSARRGRYAVAGLAAAAVAAAAAVGIDHLATAGSHRPSADRTDGPSTVQSGGVHIHLAAFSVDTNPSGSVTVQLSQGQVFNPSDMREALAQADVPALVTVGSVCTAPGPSTGLPQVMTHEPSSGGRIVTTINPSAIPAGEKLSIGYFAVPNGGGLHISLVPDNAQLTCTSTPPAPPRHGSGGTR